MNSFEWFLLILVCASLVVGSAAGYAAGKGEAKERARRAYNRGHRDGYVRGYREGSADSNDEDVLTEAENVYAPKRAVDVRLSE